MHELKFGFCVRTSSFWSMRRAAGRQQAWRRLKKSESAGWARRAGYEIHLENLSRSSGLAPWKYLSVSRLGSVSAAGRGWHSLAVTQRRRANDWNLIDAYKNFTTSEHVRVFIFHLHRGRWKGVQNVGSIYFKPMFIKNVAHKHLRISSWISR